MKFLLILFPLFLYSQMKNGDDLINSMFKAYEKKMFETFTFKQITSFYDKDEKLVRKATWLEAAALGKLRINIENFTDGNIILFKNDSSFSFKNKELKNKRPFVHALAVLVFDVYLQKPEKSSASLKKLGFDFSKIRNDNYEGNDVFVVGADKDDLKSSQFWIAINNMQLVRLIEPTDEKKEHIMDVNMSDFYSEKNFVVAKKVIIKMDGKLYQTEDYFDLKFNPILKEDVFNINTLFNTTF
jgi:hypothetical protein